MRSFEKKAEKNTRCRECNHNEPPESHAASLLWLGSSGYMSRLGNCLRRDRRGRLGGVGCRLMRPGHDVARCRNSGSLLCSLFRDNLPRLLPDFFEVYRVRVPFDTVLMVALV